MIDLIKNYKVAWFIMTSIIIPAFIGYKFSVFVFPFIVIPYIILMSLFNSYFTIYKNGFNKHKEY